MGASRRRERRRMPMIREKDRRREIVDRVLRFYGEDEIVRSGSRQRRLDLYAKYRQETEGYRRWKNSADFAMPDMASTSLRVQDTLNNAFLSTRPAIVASSLAPVDQEKEEIVNQLLDFQFFEEQRGESTVEDAAELFVNEPCVTLFTMWVDERRKHREVFEHDPIPETLEPMDFFRGILINRFGAETPMRAVDEEDGFDWILYEGDTAKKVAEVHFYTTDSGVEMVVDSEVEFAHGPKVVVKNFDDVLCPARAANLQPPGPSNPGGASRVTLVDHPTVDEVRRLQADGFYDLIDAKDVEELMPSRPNVPQEELERQKDAIAGQNSIRETEEASHGTVTRLLCFDLYDVDGDGINEDVMWWVLVEPRLLLRAKRLSEVYPCRPPRRPFSEGSFLPVKGRREGISLLEARESTHDLLKAIMDLAVDAGTLASIPFFGYRASSQVKSEDIVVAPGVGIPLANPREDISFQDLSSNGLAFLLNLFAITQQMDEKLTMVGDLQFGRVPLGKSSALRTVGGVQTLLGQGEARPERILRRFFTMWRDAFSLMHDLNQHFLPKGKQFRVVGTQLPNDDPYRQIGDPREIEGHFRFTFKPNVLNSSKQVMQQTLQSIMGLTMTDLGFQLGITDAETVYRQMSKLIRALGQEPLEFIKPPTEKSALPRFLASEAWQMFLDGQVPEGLPLEPAEQHFQELLRLEEVQRQLAAEDRTDGLSPRQIQALSAWKQRVSEIIAEERRQQQLLQAAQSFQQGQGGGEAGPRSTLDPSFNEPTPLNENELLDEGLPGAQGRIQ